MNDFDVILVGGGLQSGLLACALAHREPSCKVLIIEQYDKLGGNHTWSFHPEDVPEESKPWVDPLVSSRWSNYQVRLSGFQRQVNLNYASITSYDFASHVSGLKNTSIRLSTEVTKIGIADVQTQDGETYNAQLIVDNRGPVSDETIATIAGGYQKFFGFEIETDQAWPVENPIVMDDSVDQTDGFHFIYTLPFTAHRILVEDTRFSNTKSIDRDSCFQEVQEYLRKIGIENFRIIREESGCLPMPMSKFGMPRAATPLAGGYAGGWFHASTGYSFPMAVAFAQAVASNRLSRPDEAIERLAQKHKKRAWFARFLNRLLFSLVAPEKRYQIFRRFYKALPESRIARFYSHQFTSTDAARIVIGMPPGGLRPIEFLKSFSPAYSPSLESRLPRSEIPSQFSNHGTNCSLRFMKDLS